MAETNAAPTCYDRTLKSKKAAVGVAGGLALYFALSKVPQIREFAESVSAKKK